MSPNKSSKNSDFEKLIKSVEKLSSIFDSDIDGTAYVDISGKVVRTNKKLMEMMGYKPNETVGKNILKLGDIEPKDIPKVAKAIKEVITTGKVIKNLDVTLIRKDGYRLSTKISAVALKKEGKIIGIKTSVRDITESKRALEELKESEEKYKAIFEGSIDGILVADTETKRFIFANPEICKITGYTLKELLKLNVDNIHPKKDLPYVLNQFRKQVEGKITLAKNIPVLRKDKKIIYCDVNSKIIKIRGQELMLGLFRDITERKQSEERFRLAAKSSNDLIYEWNLARSVQWFGKIDEMLGYHSGEFPRTLDAWVDSIHPDDRKRVTSAIQAHLKRRVPYSIEYRIRGKDGAYRWWSARGVVTRTLDGKPVKWIGTITDITERKRAEEEIKNSENKYRTLVENIPQKIFLKDNNLIYISCNENYARDLKIKPDDIIGKTDYDFYPKKLAEKYRKDDKRIMKSRKMENIEEEYIQDGKKVFVSTIKVPIRDEKENVTGLLGVFWDITDKRKDEEAIKISEEIIKESEEKYRNLFEFAPDGIYLNDLKGTFIDGNKVAEELTGYKKKELIGKNFLKLRLLSPMQMPKAAALLSKNALGMPTGPDEFILNHKDGSKVVVEIRTIPIKTKDKILVFGIAHDITHRKIAEEKIKSAQEKWDSLTQNTSDIIIIVDRKGIIQYISKTVPPYTPKGTVGKAIYEYIPKDQHDKIRESFREVFKTGSQYNYETCSKIPNIGVMWFSTKLVPIKLDKDVTGIIMISTDITERKKMEDELKESHDEMNKINRQLQSKIEEMERFNKFAVGRELKMIELKNRIKKLENQLNKRYI